MELTGPRKTISRARKLRANMSLPERVLWRMLKGKQTGLRFRRQHPAGPYILDFYCDSAKICIEVDGQHHAFITERDRLRDEWLRSRGVRTVRVQAGDVLNNLDAVVRWIAAEAHAHSAALCAPPSPERED